MVKRALHALPGTLVFLTGLLVIIGWLAKIPILVSPDAVHMPMTFVSAVCFCLIGIGLFCFAFSSRIFKLIQFVAGGLLFLIATTVLLQYLYHVDIGIDHLVDSSWIYIKGINPGRVAFNAVLNFILVSFIFILMGFAGRKAIAVVIEICIFILFIIGVLSVLGYFLDMQFLYSWFSYPGMSIYSSITFTIIAICLWYFWRKSDYCPLMYRGKEAQKLMLLSGILLSTICLIVVLSSFSSSQPQQVNLMKDIIHVFPVIIFAVVIGLVLLRLEIIPLINRMANAEKELNESNARLKKSEERYALAVRGSNAGLWDWEVGTNYIFYSPYLKNMLGYTDEELPDNTQAFIERIHPDDLPMVDMALREHIQNHTPYDVEYRLRRKSGEYRWFHAVGLAKWDANGRAIRMAGSISDITERKINEKRLLLQYSVTQVLSEAENLNDALVSIVRIICNGLDWRYGAIWQANIEMNQLQFMAAWHDEKNEISHFVQNRKAMIFSPGKGTPGRAWSTRKPVWSAEITKESWFIKAADARDADLISGFCFPMMLQNTVFGVMEFFSRNIEQPDENLLQMMATIGPQVSQFIQKMHIEGELRLSEAHKSAILNSASDGIITVTEKGGIVSFNLRTEKMFGYSDRELKDKNINDLIPGLTERTQEIVNKLPVEFVGVQKNGSTFPAELTVSGTKMNEKNILVIIVRDITERKKVEKLKNEFISVVSHELRTPLTSIRGSLGLVLGGVVGSFSEKAKNLLEIANNNCERLLHLINDILDIEKIESGKMNFHMEPVDIAKIVKGSITANQMYGEKFGVRIVLVEAVSDVMVNVDADRLSQVMANLISNAVKFSRRGDTVDVSITVFNQKVRVAVTDYGEGIPKDFQSLIFQKFSQADTTSTRGKGGTGLGLNITRSIIEKMGGTIDFVSEANKKTMFYFDLPIFSKKMENKILANESESVSESVPEKKSLLICEDDEDQAEYIKAMLEKSDIHVDLAMSAGEARKLIAEKDYHGLLLDLILPDQDGISFIRELRSQPKTKNLPVIVMSVIAKTGHILLNGDAFTVLDWLDKPIDFSKLLKDVMLIKKM